MTQPQLAFEPKTKRDLLREALLSGRKMSKLDILREFGVWNSGNEIYLMRKDGIKVQTEMVERGDNRYALYFVERQCPKCGQPQEDNGLIAWCGNGHVQSLTKQDPRYSAT